MGVGLRGESLVKWPFEKSALLLNPRLPRESAEAFERGWSLYSDRFKNHIGITTSGSTGAGKIVLLSQEALEASAASVNKRFLSDASDVWFKTLPDFHVGGLGIQIRAHLSGAKVIENFEAWNASRFAEALRKARATLVSLVPTQVFDLVQAGERAPSSLRAAIIGGAKFSDILRDRAIELGWPVLPSFGMTETSSMIAIANDPLVPRLFPMSHAQVRISPAGKIEISGPSLLSATIHGEKLIERESEWFTTEDIGQIESDGSLVVLGRAGDFVKISGEGVSVSSLEERLEALKMKLQLQSDSALLVASDERLGAKIILLGTQEAEANRLRDEFNSQVAPFERIKEVHSVSNVPRSALGKLLRLEALSLVGLKPFANN